MEREEARVLHLFLRPAEFEEVVRCLQPLLHIGIVLDDNEVEDSVNRPHALHLVVVFSVRSPLFGCACFVDTPVCVLHAGCLNDN